MFLHGGSVTSTLAIIVRLTAGIPLRDDMGNMSMTINTSVPDAQR